MTDHFYGLSGWLTGNQIIADIASKKIIIDPFEESCVNPNSYNYSLGSTIKRITSEVIDCKKNDEYEIIEIPETGYVLEPGECYLGETKEIFGSRFYASLITGRSSIGRKFITNHITAGLIDQGFIGKLTLEIIVFKPTKIYPEMQFGQIFWFTTFGYSRLYEGKYQGQLQSTTSKLYLEY